jgi:hypothetical protein
MATYKKVGGAKPRSSASKPKFASGMSWQDMAGMPKTSGGGLPKNPDPRPMKPPGSGGGNFRGVVPTAYKAEHQAEWDAANHKERMAMRKAAPRVKPATSVSRTRKPKRGPASIKPPSGGLGKK